MGKDHRIAAVFDHVAGGAVAGVGTTGDHAHPCHLIEHVAAEGGQSKIVVLAAASDTIAAIVGHQHPADAKVVIKRDQADLVCNAFRTFDIEADREAAGLDRKSTRLNSSH